MSHVEHIRKETKNVNLGKQKNPLKFSFDSPVPEVI